MFRLRSIDYIRLKIKAFGELVDRKDVFSASIVVLTGISCYLLGAMAKEESARPPVTIEWIPFVDAHVSEMLAPAVDAKRTAEPSTAAVAGKYVGSRSSTKYHLPSCSGAQRISEANKVWFSTKEEAERAGYTPATNCKGL